MELIQIKQDLQGTRIFALGGMNMFLEKWMIQKQLQQCNSKKNNK